MHTKEGICSFNLGMYSSPRRTPDNTGVPAVSESKFSVPGECPMAKPQMLYQGGLTLRATALVCTSATREQSLYIFHANAALLCLLYVFPNTKNHTFQNYKIHLCTHHALHLCGSSFQHHLHTSKRTHSVCSRKLSNPSPCLLLSTWHRIGTGSLLQA